MDNSIKKFGTDPEELYRKSAPETSKDAAYRVNTTKGEEQVFRHIDNSPNGLTIKECAALMGRESGAISGRFTGLKKKRLIYQTEEKREKSFVMKIRREAEQGILI